MLQGYRGKVRRDVLIRMAGRMLCSPSRTPAQRPLPPSRPAGSACQVRQSNGRARPVKSNAALGRAPQPPASAVDLADVQPGAAGLGRGLDQRDDGSDGGRAEIQMDLPEIAAILRPI